mgnify:CR=1 FL=1
MGNPSPTSSNKNHPRPAPGIVDCMILNLGSLGIVEARSVCGSKSTLQTGRATVGREKRRG